MRFESRYNRAKISGSNLFTRLNYWIVACGATAIRIISQSLIMDYRTVQTADSSP